MKKFLILTALATFMIASCEPEESTTEPVAVEGIELNETSVTILVGETYRLTAAIFPENAETQTVVWESSDTSIATVDETGLLRQ